MNTIHNMFIVRILQYLFYIYFYIEERYIFILKLRDPAEREREEGEPVEEKTKTENPKNHCCE
jgi:hypothetical protein